MLILTPLVIILLFLFWMIRNWDGDGGGCLPVLCCSVAICVFSVSLCGMEGCSTEDSSEDEDAVSLLQAVPPSGEEDDAMVLIPAGAFSMGADDGDPEAAISESPAHTVNLAAFYINKYEVTNAEFKKFVDANPEWAKDNFQDGFYLAHWKDNTYPIFQAKHPVTNVNWHAAMAYATWAGKRLPTEAEWEKAARGGLIGQDYPWGNTIDATKANYNYRVGETSIVGEYSANGYGLYDLAGNVWEWCLDGVEDYKELPNSNPLGGVSDNTFSNYHEIATDFTKVTNFRILRGGSCFSRAEDVRLTVRAAHVPKNSLGSVGFRCAKDFSP